MVGEAPTKRGAMLGIHRLCQISYLHDLNIPHWLVVVSHAVREFRAMTNVHA